MTTVDEQLLDTVMGTDHSGHVSQEPESAVSANDAGVAVLATDVAGGATRRVVVIGAVPGAGASTVAWSIASAARTHDGVVDVVDAASPRRSQLRGACPTVGVARHVRGDAQLVPATGSGMRVQFIDASLDTRLDQVAAWVSDAGEPVTTRVVDVGISAEEILTHAPDSAAWLTGSEAVASTVVLVIPTAVMAAARCEAVLAGWAAAGWVGIDQVVAVGAPAVATHGIAPLLGKALAGAQVMPPVPHLDRVGLPAAGDDSAQWQVWIRTGHQVLAAAGGTPYVAGKARRWRKRGG